MNRSPPHTQLPMRWWVYVLTATASGRTYVGSTTDPLRRLRQHNGIERGGASATRVDRPWRLALAFGPLANRSHAQKIEGSIKCVRGRDRLAWQAGTPGPERMPAKQRVAINRAAGRAR